MKTTIHPHWDATDSGQPEQQPQTRQQRAPARVSIAVPQGSRRPAAIFGIVAVIGLGFLAVQNMGFFAAQVAPAPVIVRIAATGATPKNFSIQQGQSITWKNTDVKERVLASDLMTVDGPFEDLIIPSGSSATITIADDLTPGSYAYTDPADGDALLGKVTVTKKVAATTAASTSTAAATTQTASSAASVQSVAASSASTASAAASATSSKASTASSAAAVASAVSSSSASAKQVVVNLNGNENVTLPLQNAAGSSSSDDMIGGIARNPHTVGTAPASAATAPSETLHSGAPLARPTPVYTAPSPVTYGANAVASAPTTVAKTGPEVWLLAFLSVGAVFWFCRRSLFAD